MFKQELHADKLGVIEFGDLQPRLIAQAAYVQIP